MFNQFLTYPTTIIHGQQMKISEELQYFHQQSYLMCLSAGQGCFTFHSQLLFAEHFTKVVTNNYS